MLAITLITHPDPRLAGCVRFGWGDGAKVLVAIAVVVALIDVVVGVAAYPSVVQIARRALFARAHRLELDSLSVVWCFPKY